MSLRDGIDVRLRGGIRRAPGAGGLGRISKSEMRKVEILGEGI